MSAAKPVTSPMLTFLDNVAAANDLVADSPLRAKRQAAVDKIKDFILNGQNGFMQWVYWAFDRDSRVIAMQAIKGYVDASLGFKEGESHITRPYVFDLRVDLEKRYKAMEARIIELLMEMAQLHNTGAHPTAALWGPRIEEFKPLCLAVKEAWAKVTQLQREGAFEYTPA